MGWKIKKEFENGPFRLYVVRGNDYMVAKIRYGSNGVLLGTERVLSLDQAVKWAEVFTSDFKTEIEAFQSSLVDLKE